LTLALQFIKFVEGVVPVVEQEVADEDVVNYLKLVEGA